MDGSKITKLEIPNTATTIGQYAFYNGKDITQIDIPSSVTSIGEGAFNSTAPTAFICRSTTPFSLGANNAFGGQKKVYVPYKSMDDYKSAWSNVLSTSSYTYLPLLDVMFFEKTGKDAYQTALSGKNKNAITSVAFYDGGIDDDLTESIMKRNMNPNCLYFVPKDAGLSGDNIITLDDYKTDYVSLTDNYTYDCPIPFHASTIEYVHNPSVWATGKSGWETMVLPFTATEFEASESGSLFPILRGASGDFWIRKYVGSSAKNVYFQSMDEAEMQAQIPYLVAFPGKSMGTGYLEGQTITFRGIDQDVAVTEVPTEEKNCFNFIGNYDTTEDGVTGYELNAAGSAFVQSTTVGKTPFRTYFVGKDDVNNIKQLGITFGTYNESTGIFEVEEDETANQEGQNVYDLTGRRAKVNGKGIYIVNGKKVIKL